MTEIMKLGYDNRGVNITVNLKTTCGCGLLLLSVNILLHIGNLGFQMPYSQDLIVPP